jgi:ribosomal protein L3 glutamine methyltransferase
LPLFLENIMSETSPPGDAPQYSPDYTQAIAELVTIRDWIRWGASQFNRAGLFFGHGTTNGWDDAATLVLWSLHTPWEHLQSVEQARLTTEERQHIASLFRRRLQERIPVAYLTGEAWFAGLKFAVNEDVLVPRSPIAELIQQQFQPWLTQEPQRILDLCTGSGCIGIACAYAFPDAGVTLSDISEAALTVARRNVHDHQLEDRVQVVNSDGFATLQGQVFDLIVSNPPYVDAEDMAAVAAEYRAEPELALVSGSDGLDFTRRILREACIHLSPQGMLIVEVGNSWVALERAFPRIPFTWLEFEHGGHGVFALTAADLRASL